MSAAELFEDDRTAGTRWRVVTASDPAARAIADRHYNRKTIGAPTVGPPGARLVLVAVAGSALWITHYPKPGLSLDGIDALRCSSFRNEEDDPAGLSSELIVEAMLVTTRAWPDVRPAGGWLTFVDRSKTRTYSPGPWARSLVRLRAELLEP